MKTGNGLFSLALGIAVVTAGCTTWQSYASPTEATLANDFAAILAVRPGQVQVRNIQTGEHRTFFTAITPNGTFECS